MLVVILMQLGSEHLEKLYVVPYRLRAEGVGMPCACLLTTERGFLRNIIAAPSLVPWPLPAEVHLFQAQELKSIDWF